MQHTYLFVLQYIILCYLYRRNYTIPHRKVIIARKSLKPSAKIDLFLAQILKYHDSDENISLEEFLLKYKETKESSLEKLVESTERANFDSDIIDLRQLSISTFKQRTSLCSDETMMKHFNLNNQDSSSLGGLVG